MGDTTRFVRSVSPDVTKLGFWPAPDSSGRYAGGTMRFADFLTYARRTRAEGARVSATVPKEITIYDIMDQTANVKVRGSWGVDYLLLARHEDRWIITHVLWQTEPRRSSAPTTRP